MAKSYYINSPAAQLKITAISALHGSVIQTELQWIIVSDDQQPVENAHNKQPAADHAISNRPEAFCETYYEAQPLLTLHPDTYRITARYRNKNYSFSSVTLERQTLLDIVVLIHDIDQPDPNEAYHVDRQEVTTITEHQRRMLERNGQNTIAIAVTPLADPYPPEQQGQGVPVHPLIGKAAQFSGMPDSQRPDPAGNEEALRKSLELQKQLQNNPNSVPSPAPLSR